MRLKVVQIDAFSNGPFTGNPAAVILLDEWLTDERMQQIAEEINLSETAFLVKENDHFNLRWFTPITEVRLCGHATLASAHALYEEMGYDGDQITFKTKSGDLFVERSESGEYRMNFPSDVPQEIEELSLIEDALGVKPEGVYRGMDDYLVLLQSEEDVLSLNPDFNKLHRLEDSRGTIVTAKGNKKDFVSRGFFPQCGINEDPATGSAHTVLTPFWAARLGKLNFSAEQLSKRRGYFTCDLENDRVILKGKAVTTIVGEMRM